MNRKLMTLLLVICTLSIPLVGCETVAQAQQPEPTSTPALPSLSADTNRPITPVTPASVTDAYNSTRANAASSSGSIGELRGSWSAGTNSKLDIQISTQANLSWGGGLVRMHGITIPGSSGFDCDILEWFTIDAGILTWGDPSFPCWASGYLTGGFEEGWLNNPTAMYRVTITRTSGQPDTLVLSLVSEDQVAVRQGLIDGKTFTRAGKVNP